jgi:hypothetical protein
MGDTTNLSSLTDHHAHSMVDEQPIADLRSVIPDAS